MASIRERTSRILERRHAASAPRHSPLSPPVSPWRAGHGLTDFGGKSASPVNEDRPDLRPGDAAYPRIATVCDLRRPLRPPVRVEPATTAAARCPGRRARSRPPSSRRSRSAPTTHPPAGSTIVSTAMPELVVALARRSTPSRAPDPSWRARAPPISHHAAGLPPPPSSISAHSMPSRASSGCSPRFSTLTSSSSIGSSRPPPRRICFSTRRRDGEPAIVAVPSRDELRAVGIQAHDGNGPATRSARSPRPPAAHDSRRRVGGEHADEAAAALVVVVDQAARRGPAP